MEMQEEFKVLLLNRSNRVIGVYDASTGGICGTVVDPRLILATALKSLSVSLILAHNHPSGVLDPSHADLAVAARVWEEGLGTALVDNDATRLHRRFVAMRFAAVELARRARSAPHTDDRLFVSHLVDLVAGVLAAPLSDETRRLDAERARAVDADPTSVPTYAP